MQSMLVIKEIEALLNRIMKIFYTASDKAYIRYILSVGKCYYVLRYQNNTPAYEKIDTLNKLYSFLEAENNQFIALHIDKNAVFIPVLRAIYTVNKAAVMQCFYYHKKNKLHLYVLDEKGSLFYHIIDIKSNEHVDITLHHFIAFLQSIVVRLSNDNHQISLIVKSIMYLNDENITFSDTHLTRSLQQYIHLLVIADVDSSGSAYFQIYCNDTLFSSIEYENIYYTVAKYIVSLRKKSSQVYPIYINDMDISPHLLTHKQRVLQGIHFLRYKMYVEKKLNHYLTSIVEDRLSSK